MNFFVVIPCYNEEKTIFKVVNDFRKELPKAKIIVYDNNSTDNTIAEAKRAGAIIKYEKKQGKGYVIQSMFNEIEADVYIMVDGDDTYPSDRIKELIQPILNEEADMVIATRLENSTNKTLKPLHQFGNKLIVTILNFCFQSKLKDILSGYRIMNRNFVKNIPLLSKGFEIETELTFRAMEMGFRIKEIPIQYKARVGESQSKLRSFRDGSRIIMIIISLFKDYKPVFFFSLLTLLLIITGLLLGGVVIKEYLATGLVLKFPTAILATSFVILGFISLISGFIISTMNRRFKEMNVLIKRMLKK